MRNTLTLRHIHTGTMQDLEVEREVPRELAGRYAELQGMIYMECSALTGANVKEVFHAISTPCVQR